MRHMTQRGVLALAVMSFALVHSAESSSSTSGGSGGSHANFVRGHAIVSFSSPDPDAVQRCRYMPYDASLNIPTDKDCSEVCPPPGLVNHHEQCVQDTWHDTYALFSEAQTLTSGRQYVIFSIAFYILVGAACRMAFPSGLPYTVGLLMLSFVIGFSGHLTTLGNDCPMHAMRLSGEDGVVQRAEWDSFTCTDCHPQSFCVTRDRTCGKGLNQSSACRWTFDELILPRQLTSMDPEKQRMDPTDHYGNPALSADHLWRPACNLFSDLFTPLASTDPHVMLVVFLPVLLFESAFFGIDVRAARSTRSSTRVAALRIASTRSRTAGHNDAMPLPSSTLPSRPCSDAR